MTWNEILLAKDIIAPNEKDFSESLLWRYAKFGYLRQHGRFWQIAQSKAVIHKASNNMCQVDFCGNPSFLWSFYNEMIKRNPQILEQKKKIKLKTKSDSKHKLYLKKVGVDSIKHPIPPVEIDFFNKLAFVKMNWQNDLRNDVWASFDKIGVKVEEDLWSE